MNSRRMIMVAMSLLICLAGYAETVESMPIFPGGDKALMEFVKNEMKYPADAMKYGVQGRVIVNFTVDTTGKIVNPTIYRGAYPSLDREALRIVSKMPRWAPGRVNGRVTAMKYMLPITFKLDTPASKQ